MVFNTFESLLQDIGKEYNLNLKPDQNNSCLLVLPTGLSLQMEIDHRGEHFIIGIDLGLIPPGKYRENIFREALKANGKPSPRLGIFSYSKQKDHLLLIEMLSLKNLTGDRIREVLKPLAEKGFTWKQALNRGEIPVIADESRSSGMFGLNR